MFLEMPCCIFHQVVFKPFWKLESCFQKTFFPMYISMVEVQSDGLPMHRGEVPCWWVCTAKMSYINLYRLISKKKPRDIRTLLSCSCQTACLLLLVYKLIFCSQTHTCSSPFSESDVSLWYTITSDYYIVEMSVCYLNSFHYPRTEFSTSAKLYGGDQENMLSWMDGGWEDARHHL